MADPELFEQYKRAREAQALLFADETIDIADDGTNDFVELERKRGTVVVADYEHIQRSKLRVQTRQWLSSVQFPRVFGKMRDPEGGGSGGPPVSVSFNIVLNGKGIDMNSHARIVPVETKRVSNG